MMPDDFDRVQLRCLEDQAEIQRVATAIKRGLEPVGLCHNCGDPVLEPGGLFCPGGECRDDYQRRLDARDRKGG